MEARWYFLRTITPGATNLHAVDGKPWLADYGNIPEVSNVGGARAKMADFPMSCVQL